MQTATIPKLVEFPAPEKLPCERRLDHYKARVTQLERELADHDEHWRPNGIERNNAIMLRRAAATYFAAAKSTDDLQLAIKANAQHSLGTAILERLNEPYNEYVEGRKRLNDQIGLAKAEAENYELYQLPQLRKDEERQRATEQARLRGVRYLQDLARPGEVVVELADGSQVIRQVEKQQLPDIGAGV